MLELILADLLADLPLPGTDILWSRMNSNLADLPLDHPADQSPKNKQQQMQFIMLYILWDVFWQPFWILQEKVGISF